MYKLVLLLIVLMASSLSFAKPNNTQEQQNFINVLMHLQFLEAVSVKDNENTNTSKSDTLTEEITFVVEAQERTKKVDD